MNEKFKTPFAAMNKSIGGTAAIEKRTAANRFELRFDSGNKPRIAGYAAVFNSFSEDFGGWKEIIMPGAFSESLANGDDVRALVNHDPSAIIGRSTAGTLTLKEDSTGLFVEIAPPDTTLGRDLIESVKRGDLSQMSFAFNTIEDKWRVADGFDVREVHAAKLFDVSIVAYPAYADTSVAVRSMADIAREGRERLGANDGVGAASAMEMRRRKIHLMQLDCLSEK